MPPKLIMYFPSWALTPSSSKYAYLRISAWNERLNKFNHCEQILAKMRMDANSSNGFILYTNKAACYDKELE